MANDFIVQKKQRTTILYGGSEPVQGYRVWFVVPSTDTYDYIEVPETQDDPKTINDMITAKVKTIKDTFAL